MCSYTKDVEFGAKSGEAKNLKKFGVILIVENHFRQSFKTTE
jgi:hypothetical protein